MRCINIGRSAKTNEDRNQIILNNILHIFQIIYAFLLVLPYFLSHIIQRRYSKYSVFDCGGWKIVISSRLSMARRQWLWKLCPWARLIMIHVIQWWQHPSLVFSILLMYTVHTLHCQPRASPTETMENEFTYLLQHNNQYSSVSQEKYARGATLMRIMTECRADRGVYIRLDVTPSQISAVYCVDTGLEE